MKTRILLTLALLLLGLNVASAQTTAFTYQGKLSDGGNPANGNYDLTFQLFDTPGVGTGTPQGAALNLSSVAVSNGIFTAQLDFGSCANCFNGANRFLEIAARPSGAGSFITLSPRQPITSTPYAVRSASALSADGLSLTCVNCVTSSQIQSVQGSQVTGNIPGGQINGTIPVASVPPGSASYVQNGTSVQPNSDFNVSGNGVVGGNLGIGTSSPQTKLHVVGQDVRVESNAPGISPRFSWNFSGGAANEKIWQAYATTGAFKFTTLSDAEASERVWLQANRKGNSIDSVSIPVERVGIGDFSFNPQFTLHIVDFAPNLRVESSAIGPPSVPRFSFNMAQAQPNEKKWQHYAAPNAWIFSALNDAETQEDAWLVVSRTGASISNVVFPRGAKITDGNGPLTRPTLRVENANPGGAVASFGNNGEFQVDSVINGPAGRFVIKENGRVGIGTNNPGDALDVQGAIRMNGLGLAGNFQLCQNTQHQISGCSSSLRYKTDLHPFTKGLNLINELHPLTFKWKADQSLDLGLGAEDVAAVEPLLVTHNANGEVEGVKYDRLSAVFINAFKEQQSQIQQQQAQIASQANQIRSQGDALAALRTRLALLEQAQQHQRQRKSIRKRT